MNRRTQFVSLAPRTWLGRFLALAVGVALLLLAALFATIALAVGALIAAFLIARAYWIVRKAGKRREREFLSAEYTVEPEATEKLDDRTRERSARTR